jgi:hypothetical protein
MAAKESNATETDGQASIEQETRIRELAYELWEAEGQPEGRADHYWHRAREIIEDQAKSAYPPAQSRGHRS